jgi:hypothetical protein
VSPRSRFASRLTLWAFAAALVLKSAVPMLAAAAAGLQGKPVAEICEVYGVDTSLAGVQAAGERTIEPVAAMAHHHGHDHVAAVAQPRSDMPQPAPGHHHVGHASDHCALTGMVAIATGDAPALATSVTPGAPSVLVPPAAAAAFDAAARWAALLEHGPPVFS